MNQPLTTKELAKARGCSVRTILRLVESGSLTPVGKLPGKTGAYLFSPDEVRNVKRPHAA